MAVTERPCIGGEPLVFAFGPDPGVELEDAGLGERAERLADEVFLGDPAGWVRLLPGGEHDAACELEVALCDLDAFGVAECFGEDECRVGVA